MVRILLADDHEVIRRGLRQLIERHADWEVCGEATTGAQATDQAAALKPDVVILDLNMPGSSGIAVASDIHAAVPETELLIFSVHEGEEIIQALIGAGARGYILKSDPPSQILAAIEALASHQPFFSEKISEALRQVFLRAIESSDRSAPSNVLTPREREVIQLLAEGKPNKRVASALGISVKTVETHRAAIMRKLDLKSIVELVHYAVRNKIISP